MSDFVTLTCPSCGAKLEITKDIDRFACAHCGTEHVVRRSCGLVSLAPVVDEIKRVGVGVDKTASELAIQRLTKEIAELEQEKNKISTNPSVIKSEYTGEKPRTPESVMLAFIVALVIIIIGFVWGYSRENVRIGGYTAPALCFIPLGAVFVACTLFMIVLSRAGKTEEKQWDAIVGPEIAKRQREIARLEQEIADKQEQLRKHQELVSSK